MDKKIKAALSIVVIVFLTSLTVFVNVLIYNYSNVGNTTIQVRGEGLVSVVPDVIEMSFSVVTTGENSETAVNLNNEKMQKVIDYLKSEDVDDIKTTTFSLYPLYDYYQETGRRTIYGYEVTNMIEIKLRDFEKASHIIDGVVTSGANKVTRFVFTIENEEEYKKEARDTAIKQARERAEDISKSLGLRVGKVVGFSEEGDYYYPIMREMSAKDSSSVPIEPGENEVNVVVRVEYEIK